ncbi:nfx1-type Zinc finger-containing protein 1 [Plakobranchus ocellatus]|uniref:Nfx1-type Zinc finger-containing protein 1 n=1 Tax=Plakobranchus ocellatus TaxID=259542 RepID=A0AAV4AAC2_9GAST|nr:nfx1-type Zinc finger-containing protein 1 [Plakobranchus ocellatus]
MQRQEFLPWMILSLCLMEIASAHVRHAWTAAMPASAFVMQMIQATAMRLVGRDKLKADSLYGYGGNRTTRFEPLDCGHVLETEFVDQWMITKLGTEDSSDQTVIGLKTCPLCKAPIRKCQR